MGQNEANQNTSTPRASAVNRHATFFRAAVGTVIALGVALRIWRFAQPRGVMHDEALLAANVLDKSLPQLFQPLDLGH